MPAVLCVHACAHVTRLPLYGKGRKEKGKKEKKGEAVGEQPSFWAGEEQGFVT